MKNQRLIVNKCQVIETTDCIRVKHDITVFHKNSLASFVIFADNLFL